MPKHANSYVSETGFENDICLIEKYLFKYINRRFAYFAMKSKHDMIYICNKRYCHGYNLLRHGNIAYFIRYNFKVNCLFCNVNPNMSMSFLVWNSAIYDKHKQGINNNSKSYYILS